MCIRDRIRACLEKSVAYANTRTTFGQPIAKHQLVQQMIATMVRGYETCLLYTSDAADERSSVDLGGRRIIKKKKNTENSRSDI